MIKRREWLLLLDIALLVVVPLLLFGFLVNLNQWHARPWLEDKWRTWGGALILLAPPFFLLVFSLGAILEFGAGSSEDGGLISRLLAKKRRGRFAAKALEIDVTKLASLAPTLPQHQDKVMVLDTDPDLDRLLKKKRAGEWLE